MLSHKIQAQAFYQEDQDKNKLPSMQQKKNHIVIRSFSYKKMEPKNILPNTTKNNPQKIQSQFQSTSTSKYFQDKETQPSTTGMKTYYHTLSSNFGQQQQQQTAYKALQMSRNNTSQSMRLQPIPQQKIKNQMQSMTLGGNGEGFNKKQSPGTLNRTGTQDFYNTYFSDKRQITDRSQNQEDLIEIDENNQFINTPHNKHLYFLNFMHDQSNPPRIDRNIKIPQEDEIKKDYRFQIKETISKYENPKTQINFLNSGWEKDFHLIESIIEGARKQVQEYEQEKIDLKQDIDKIRDKYTKEIQAISDEFKEKMKIIPQKIKEDYVNHQNEQFRLHKEIVKLDKDKLELEEKVQVVSKEIEKIEVQMFGFPIFDLQANDSGLNHISEMNVRPDVTAYTMTNYKDTMH